MEFLEKVPGPAKVVAGVAAGLVAVRGFYNSGRVDQKHEDRVHLRRSFERD